MKTNRILLYFTFLISFEFGFGVFAMAETRNGISLELQNKDILGVIKNLSEELDLYADFYSTKKSSVEALSLKKALRVLESKIPNEFLETRVSTIGWKEKFGINELPKWSRSRVLFSPIDEGDIFTVFICYDNYSLSAIYQEKCFPILEEDQFVSNEQLQALLKNLAHNISVMKDDKNSLSKDYFYGFAGSLVLFITAPASAPVLLLGALAATGMYLLYEAVSLDSGVDALVKIRNNLISTARILEENRFPSKGDGLRVYLN